jgi:hypothetical protein
MSKKKKRKEVIVRNRHLRKKSLDSENDAPPLPKKKVGQPPKTKNSGGIVVDFGSIVSTYIASNIYHSFSHFLPTAATSDVIMRMLEVHHSIFVDSSCLSIKSATHCKSSGCNA